MTVAQVENLQALYESSLASTPSETGAELVNNELAERLANIQAGVFDVDDLLIERKPEALYAKLNCLAIWLHGEPDEKEKMHDVYYRLLQNPTSDQLIEVEERVRALSSILYENQPDALSMAAKLFTAAHFDESLRDIAATVILNTNDPHAFWKPYRNFGEPVDSQVDQNLLLRPTEGSLNLLEHMRVVGLPRIIVSNQEGDRLQRRLGVLGIPLSDFSLIVSAADLDTRHGYVPGSEYSYKKPNPYALEYAMNEMGIEKGPDNLYPVPYFGNGKHDAEAAYRAKYAVPIVINTGRGNFSQFTTPHLRFGDLSHFSSFWRSK